MRTNTLYMTLIFLAVFSGCDGDPVRTLTFPDGRLLTIDDGGVAPQADGWQPAPDLVRPPPPNKHDLGPSPEPDKGAPPPPKPDAGLPPGDYDYTKHIKFHQISGTGKPCNTAVYGQYYCDVMGHTKSPYYGGDTLTNVHESQHFMAHEHDGSTPAADKFIYLRNGKGAFWPEPQLKTQGIYSSIMHKGTTYNTYIAQRPGQAIGENIVDEWRAYLTEEIVAIQMAKIKGQTSGVSGLVLGGVEFLYYNAAALHALQTKEPGFLKQNPQAVAVFAMLAEEAKAWTIDKGLTPNLFAFPQKAKQLLGELRTAPQNAHIRNTLKSLYGPKWTSRVLGF
jgi:hypothetical protein